MVNAILWDASPSMISYLTTELNSLANATIVVGAEIDLTASLKRFMSVELVIAEQGAARSAGAYVGIYIIYAVDGSNYDYGAVGTPPAPNKLVGTFALDAAVTARLLSLNGIMIHPFKCKLLVINQTGQAFAALGNTLKYGLYTEELQ